MKEEAVAVELEKGYVSISGEKVMEDCDSTMDCVKGNTNSRRTRVTSLCWFVQATCGAGLIGYATYFYENASVSIVTPFTLGIIQYCHGFGVNFILWGLSKYVEKSGKWSTSDGCELLFYFRILLKEQLWMEAFGDLW